MKFLQRVETVGELRARVQSWRRVGLSVAMVPTMGALHEGHVSLMQAALAKADRCVVSIFVNPTQFAPTEDLNTYPRQLDMDIERLAGAGVQLAYIPSASEMYPSGFATKISVGGTASGLETDFRPTFFEGVATIVAKLFLQATPDFAIFGEKDYQQLCVVRQLCRDLDLPVEIIGAPTVRDAYGLALSSRNAYLSSAELAVARQLNTVLRNFSGAITQSRDPDGESVKARLALQKAGFDTVDYVAARECLTLTDWQAGRVGRLLAAVWLGKTRLIDNVEIAAK